MTVGSAIAFLFQDYLEARVKCSSLPLPLKYHPATSEDPTSKTFIPECLDSNSSTEDIIIFRPTTPLFYAKVALSSRTSEFVFSTLHCSDPLKSVFYTNHPDLLQELFNDGVTHTPCSKNVSPLIWLRWLPIRLSRGFQTSDLDHYAKENASSATATRYRRAVLKLLVAQCCTFGSVEVVDFIIWCVRVWLLWQWLEGSIAVLMQDYKDQSIAQVFRSIPLKVWGYHLWCTANKIF